MHAQIRILLRWLLLPAMIFVLSCGGSDRQEAGKAHQGPASPPLDAIENQEQFNHIIASAGDRLLLFDVYADWCLPCKELEPILESIASSNPRSTDIYKINLDEHPYLFDVFQVRGIPLVVFVRNQTVVYSLMGLRPKEAYLEAIRSFSRS